MDAQISCCRYEPDLEDLIADEMMAPVLRSAGLDRQGLRDMMVSAAQRIRDRTEGAEGSQAEDN